MSLEALSGYFDNLAAAATNEKLVLEDLVANLTTLATSNAEMEDMIKKLTGENWQLQQQLNILQKKLPDNDSHGAAQFQLAARREKKGVLTASRKCGMSRTTALNFPKMLRNVHQYRISYCDVVGRLTV